MIKVLFLAANPADTRQLALDEEIRVVDATIRGAEHRDRLELISHWAVRLDDLSGLLMRHRPDIVHFSGHGSTSGAIMLAKGSRTSSRDLLPPSTKAGEAVGLIGVPKRQVPPAALAGLFRVLKDNVRVVIFNACYSETQARAVVKEVDCAVGTSRAIDDDHAIDFAAEFYQALAFGQSVGDAYELGVVRLIGEGVPDARKLVKLHKRRGVDPAAIVLVGNGAAARPWPIAPSGPPGKQRTQSTLRLLSANKGAAPALVFNDRIVTIGRSPASMVRVDDAEVSWEHGVITLRNGEYVYTHLSQTNPTLLQRRKEETLLAENTVKEAVLRNQDRLTIGSETFVVEFDLITETSGYVGTKRAPGRP